MKVSKALVNLGEQEQKHGSIKTFRHSSKLYADFYYFGMRVTKSTGLNDTPENRALVQKFLNKIFHDIETQTFRFADVFDKASEQEKTHFSQLEGREFHPEPHQVMFRDYVKTWRAETIPELDSASKRRDYEQPLDTRILPFFKDMNFYQITSLTLQKFVKTLVWGEGKNQGKQLSRSRINNVMIPLKAIWNDACDHYRWNIRSPFETIGKKLPEANKTQPTVLRFDQWQEVLRHTPEFYHPVMELMVMTGIIASEIKGLRKRDIENNYISVRNKIVLGEEKEKLKTWYRTRRIPITRAIRVRLEEAMRQSASDYVFVMEDGSEFDYGSFKKTIWEKAFQKAGIEYQRPYVTRHTFAAWALTIQTDPNKLVSLMGHSTKKMVYEVYGNYVEGLEEDAEDILDYFGEDFIKKERPRALKPVRVERREAEAGLTAVAV